jgi:hypothetical protein
MNSYRERRVNAIIYWTILSIPLVYFLIDQLYRSILPDLLSSYFTTDPVTASIYDYISVLKSAYWTVNLCDCILEDIQDSKL